MTRDFDLFVESLQGHDDFDLWALDRLGGEERLQVEEMMLDLLRRRDDSRAIDALKALGTPSALAAIRAALASPIAEVAVRAAGAMDRTDPAAALQGALRALEAPDRTPRVWAVQILRGLPGDVAGAALLRATDDPAANVRVAAADAIFHRSGLERFLVPRHAVTLLWMRLTSEASAIRREARTELAALVAQLEQGRSPEERGLIVPPRPRTPALERFLHSRRRDEPDAEDYDLAALDALDAEDRAWVELDLIGSLEGFDPRVPRALLHMRSTHALEPLLARARRLVEARWKWPARDPGTPGALDMRSQGLFYVEVARALWHGARVRQEAEALLRAVAGHPDPDVRARALTAMA